MNEMTPNYAEMMTKNMAILSQNLVAMQGNIGDISASIDTMKSDIRSIEARSVAMEEGFEEFKRSIRDNERITRLQYKMMTKAIRTRIYSLLSSYPLDRVRRVYSRRFFPALYRDARQNTNMAEPASETKKVDYDSVMAFIEAWRPKNGVAEFVEDIECQERNRQITLDDIKEESRERIIEAESFMVE